MPRDGGAVDRSSPRGNGTGERERAGTVSSAIVPEPGVPDRRMILLIAGGFLPPFTSPSGRVLPVFACANYVACHKMGWISRINQQAGDKHDK